MGCHTNSLTDVEILCVLETLSWRGMRDTVRTSGGRLRMSSRGGWKGTHHTSSCVLSILPVDEAAGAESHRRSRGPGEAAFIFICD